MRDDIRALLNTPRPIDAKFAALFPATTLHRYALRITGMGAAAGLHQNFVATAPSLGDAIDDALDAVTTYEVDGAQWTIHAERLPSDGVIETTTEPHGSMG